MRGVDDKGNCANFVETEQIAIFQGKVSSFVQVCDKVVRSWSVLMHLFQTRGSIPVHWSQTPTLKYKPKPLVVPNPNIQAPSMQKHFDEQIVLYGQQTAINLINQSGSEKSLGDAFKQFLTSLSSILIKFVPLVTHRIMVDCNSFITGTMPSTFIKSVAK